MLRDFMDPGDIYSPAFNFKHHLTHSLARGPNELVLLSFLCLLTVLLYSINTSQKFCSEAATYEQFTKPTAYKIYKPGPVS